MCNRPGARSNIDSETDGVGRDHDVAVEDGCIDSVAVDRLESDLGCQIGLFDRLENASRTADRSVLGQTSPSLAHEPHRPSHVIQSPGSPQEGRIIGRHPERGVRLDQHATDAICSPFREDL